MSAAAIINEPRKMSGSELQTREQRAKALAGAFVKFIGEYTELLAQVRQDFLDKKKHESIMGCKTWTEYCVGVLHYSESHIAKLLAGRNPAAAKHDGSKNRVYPQPKPAAKPTVVPPALTKHNPELAAKIHNGAVVPRDTSYLNDDKVEVNLTGDYFRHLGHLLDGVFKGQIKEKLDAVCALPPSKITPKIQQDVKEISAILQDVSVAAEKYITKLKKISHARVA